MKKNASHVDYMFSLYRGDNWDDRMLSLNLQKVNLKTMEMVIDTLVEGDRGMVQKGLVSTSLYLDGAKIITFNLNTTVPVKRFSLWMQLPKKAEINNAYYGSFNLNFPNQIYKLDKIPIKGRHNIQLLQPRTASFFYFREIETTKHRNKYKRLCSDENNYDLVFWEHIYREVGCSPFFKPMSLLNNCTRSQLKYINDMTQSESIALQLPPPCNEISKYKVKTAIMATSVKKEEYWYPGIGKKLEKYENWARVTIELKEKFVRQIHQHRAISVQNLIGNAGGYAGLFFGVAAYDVPKMIQNVYCKLRKFL